MTKEEMYQKHIDAMFGTKNMETFPDREIEAVFDNLLQCLPNGGKLYKYRNINDEKSFDLLYKSLQEGTIWSSRVDKFPDKTDCTVNYDPLSDAKSMERLFRAHPELIVGAVMQTLSKLVGDINPDFDKTMLLRMVDCFDEQSGALVVSKALDVFKDYGCDPGESIVAIMGLQDDIDKILKAREGVIKDIAKQFLSFNQINRHNAFVCSLCEDYKVKTMWEHYAGNSGICIEYDYNKIKIFELKDKSFFCSTYKIIYADQYEENTIVPLLEEYLRCKSSKSTNNKLNAKLLLSMITKSSDYAYEKEWRTFHFNLSSTDDGFAIKADIVSGIIFDEHALESSNGKKLLELCRQRGWNIKVRKINATSTKYDFIDYEDYQH